MTDPLRSPDLGYQCATCGSCRFIRDPQSGRRSCVRCGRGMTRTADPVDVCAACGQFVLTTPDDPVSTLLCDVCLASLEARREVRRANAELNQGGLF